MIDLTSLRCDNPRVTAMLAAAAGVGAVITLGWLCILLAVYLGT